MEMKHRGIALAYLVFTLLLTACLGGGGSKTGDTSSPNNLTASGTPATTTLNAPAAVSSTPATSATPLANYAPVANAGTAQNVISGSLVTLNGSSSSDANGDPLTYSWVLTTKPTSSTATLTAATSPLTTFTADLAGTYIASLVVNDGKVNSTASTVTVTASTIAGTLDSTFNSIGKVTTTFAAGSATANAAALQVDGKIVVAGTVTSGTASSFALARYNTDGSLDTTFNSTGMVTTSIGAGNSYGNAIAIQSDGKILVVGGAQSTTT